VLADVGFVAVDSLREPNAVGVRVPDEEDSTGVGELTR
jgi:hypothetical protein